MKNKIKTTPDEIVARGYGVALENALRDVLRYPGDDIEEGLADMLLGIPDAKKAIIYGWKIEHALRYARDDVKQGLIYKFLDIPNAQKTRTKDETKNEK